MRGRRIGLALLWAAAAGAVDAGVWIVPVPLSPDAGAAVTLRIHAEAEPGAPAPTLGDGKVQHLWKRGRENLDPAEPSFVTRVPGVHLVTFASPASTSERGDRVQEFAKTLIVAGRPTGGSPLRWSEVGERLEIVPQTDPVELLRGESRLELQVLYDREPLAGATVEALPPADQGTPRRSTTDEIGVAHLTLDQAGSWRIRVRHRTRCESCDPQVMELLTSSLIVGVR